LNGFLSSTTTSAQGTTHTIGKILNNILIYGGSFCLFHFWWIRKRYCITSHSTLPQCARRNQYDIGVQNMVCCLFETNRVLEQAAGTN
jgi:hypothetical protein